MRRISDCVDVWLDSGLPSCIYLGRLVAGWFYDSMVSGRELHLALDVPASVTDDCLGGTRSLLLYSHAHNRRISVERTHLLGRAADGAVTTMRFTASSIEVEIAGILPNENRK